jgi:hypothetical protein
LHSSIRLAAARKHRTSDWIQLKTLERIAARDCVGRGRLGQVARRGDKAALRRYKAAFTEQDADRIT